MSRLHTAAAIIGVEADKTMAGAGLPAQALLTMQCLLAHAVAAMDAYIAGQLRVAAGLAQPLMERFLGRSARFCCGTICEPGAGPAQCRCSSV